MKFSTLAEDEDEDDEKVIPKTASGGRGQKEVLHTSADISSRFCYNRG